MQKTLLKKMGKKMKKLPEFLQKLGESEKVETMGRTARRRQGVFFGRLGVPERSGAGAAGSGRCAVGVFFGEGGGRAVGRAPIALVVADLVVAASEAPASPDPSWLPQAASRVMIERLKASRLKVAFMLPVYPSGTGRSLTLAPSCDYFVYER